MMEKQRLEQLVKELVTKLEGSVVLYDIDKHKWEIKVIDVADEKWIVFGGYGSATRAYSPFFRDVEKWIVDELSMSVRGVDLHLLDLLLAC